MAADKPVNFRQTSDLHGLTLGGTLGYSYGAELDAAFKAGQIKLDTAPDDMTNVRKLVAGRYDGLLMNRVVGLELVSQLTDSERSLIRVSERNLTEKPSRVCFSQKRPESEKLLKTFNAGLAKMVKDGTVRRWLEDAENGKYRASNP